jgi:hypothetical protein
MLKKIVDIDEIDGLAFANRLCFFVCREILFPQKSLTKRLPFMKLAIRIFALSLIVAGGAAAAVTPKTAQRIPSHQSATASFPLPTCVPGFPTCPNQ